MLPSLIPQIIAKPPKTIDGALNYPLNVLSQKEMDSIENMPKDDLNSLHFSPGMRIRNAFGLWLGNTELLLSCSSLFPDYASMVLVEALWEKVRHKT